MLLVLALSAVLSDLRSGRIPNGLIAAGLVCGLFSQLFDRGMTGWITFLGGAFLPVLILGILYYFRMIGAGDIKMICMAGGFMGPADCFSCIVWSVLFGGAISAAVMIYRRNVIRRLLYFAEYLMRYTETGRWNPYLAGVNDDAKFCFSIPILLGIICYIGGIY